jgi:outer membrane protein TolC
MPLNIAVVAALATIVSQGVGAATPPLQSDPLQAPVPAEATYNLSIDDAVTIAQRRSFKTARANRSLRENELRYDNAKSQFLPKLTTSVGLGQQTRELATHGTTYAYQASSLGEFQSNGKYVKRTCGAALRRPMSRIPSSMSRLMSRRAI